MIAFVVIAGIALLGVALALMPNMPATPDGLEQATTVITNMISNAVGMTTYVLSGFLLFTAITLFIIAYNFEHIYHGILWILRKIPVLGIK